MAKPNKSDWWFLAGALLMLGGALGWLWKPLAATIVFAIGLVPVCIVRIRGVYRGGDARLKRFSRLQMLVLGLYIVSAWLMYIGNKLWVILLLYAAVTELVVAWRRPGDPNNKNNSKSSVKV